MKAVEDWKLSLSQELKHQKFKDLRIRHSDSEVEVCTMETLVNVRHSFFLRVDIYVHVSHLSFYVCLSVARI